MNTCKDTIALPIKSTDKAYISTLGVVLLAFVMLLTFPDIARTSVQNSISTCLNVLIPSLFPFIVMGEIFFSCGGADALGTALGKPFNKIFGISEAGVGAFLLGLVCGLPLGGKYALDLYESGRITKNDCERLMGISSNAGPGFIVAGVGGAIWGSAVFGWLIYLCQLTAVIIIGMTLFRREKVISIAPVTTQNTKKQFSSLLCDAVSNSALNMIKLCSFVVFFSILTVFISAACAFLNLPQLFCVTLASFTEITYACSVLHTFSLSGEIFSIQSAKILTFFAIGFSGMSAHAQLSVFANRLGVSMKKHYCMRLACGLLCALLGAVVLKIYTLAL